MPRTYVLGLGNTLMGDDGFGPAVVHEFEDTYEFDEGVEVVDLGTPGLDLTPWFADTPHIIIVDTVKAALPPGSMRLYEKDDVMKHAPLARVSPHDPGVKETLATLDFADRAPETVTVIGAVPGLVRMSLELTQPVQMAVPAAVNAIRTTLERFGHKVHLKADKASEEVVMSDFAQALSA
jgi:hydrogenase maturation protease